MQSDQKKKNKVNIGCGKRAVAGFVNVDKYLTREQVVIDGDAKFAQADIVDLPMGDDTVDYIEAVSVLEYVPYEDTGKAIDEMFRVLKSGGELRVMSHDFDQLVQEYQEDVVENEGLDIHKYMALMQSIFGHQQFEGEYRKMAFNRKLLGTLLHKAGFRDIVFQIYPKGCKDTPKLETVEWNDELMMKNEMMLAIVKKP